MDPNTILLRPGEIFLKGKNISVFEKKLVENIKQLASVKEVKKIRGRFIVDYFPTHSILKKVFGLVSYSPAFKVDKEFEKIKKISLILLKEKEGTFKIETKRSDKTFPSRSLEINVILGKFIEENSSLVVDFKNPQTVLKLEINQEGAYLFLETFPCFGGLPTGVEGRVLLLIENSASLLAGLLFMKRGCSIYPIAFNGANVDLSLLQQYSSQQLKLKTVKDVHELEKFAARENIGVLVVGDNFETRKEYETDLLIFKSLIAFSQEEIEDELKKFEC